MGTLGVRGFSAGSLFRWIFVCLSLLPLAGHYFAQPSNPSGPDLRIVGWTVDDTPNGNGDGGLHPGETAFLQIYLSNQGDAAATGVLANLVEIVDHPDVEILHGVATWPDLTETGTPLPSSSPHFEVRVENTRPCAWEIPLRLDLTATGGYSVQREFVIRMVDPSSADFALGAARPFIYGAESTDLLGSAIASGDLDGDGFEDLILGAPGGNGRPGDLRSRAGEVVVVYGGPTPRGDEDLASPSQDIAFIYGEDPGDRLGSSVSAGDLDGDGFDDLILGADLADGFANSRPEAGDVTVVYGGRTRLTVVDLSSPPRGVGFLRGVMAGDGLGVSVTAGDLDGDGFHDLVLGASQAITPGSRQG